MRTLVLLATALLSLDAQAPPVAERPLRAHLAFLADDLLEGRGTGSRGGQLTVAYLEAQLRALGLQPLPGGSYRHPVALTGLRVRPEGTHLTFRPSQGEALKPGLGPELGIDAVVGTGRAQADQTFEAPLVFGGYGIQAPEEGWDDVDSQPAWLGVGWVTADLGGELGTRAATEAVIDAIRAIHWAAAHRVQMHWA